MSHLSHPSSAWAKCFGLLSVFFHWVHTRASSCLAILVILFCLIISLPRFCWLSMRIELQLQRLWKLVTITITLKNPSSKWQKFWPEPQIFNLSFDLKWSQQNIYPLMQIGMGLLCGTDVSHHHNALSLKIANMVMANVNGFSVSIIPMVLCYRKSCCVAKCRYGRGYCIFCKTSFQVQLPKKSLYSKNFFFGCA